MLGGKCLNKVMCVFTILICETSAWPPVLQLILELPALMGNIGKFGCADTLVPPQLTVLGRVPLAEEPMGPDSALVQNLNTSVRMQDVRNRSLP
jgi:hypothetical protein